jgi:hypothetical protein
MRLSLILFLTLFTVGQQSQPLSPTPTPSRQKQDHKAALKQDQAPDNEAVAKQLLAAVNQLMATIEAERVQEKAAQAQSKTPSSWVKWNTIFVTIFTACLAIVAGLQFWAMHRQANISDQLADITGKQREIAAEQLAITKANEARREIEKTEEEDAKHIRAQIEDKKYLQQLDIANANAIAAKRSADAASSNAKALMNSERPWLVPKITRIVKEIENLRIKDEPRTFRSVTYFGFWIKNVGRTPAQIVAIRGDPALNYHGIDGGFTDPPDYGLPVVYKHVRLLAPGEKWRTDHDLNIWPLFHLDGTIEKDIKSHKVHYVFKAVILYHDTFDPNTVHETRFCYTYLETMDDWYPSGPPDHTKYT